MPEVDAQTPSKKRPLSSCPLSTEKGSISPGSFAKLKQARTGSFRKGNPRGSCFAKSQLCSFCSHQKHSCGWAYRWNLKARIVTGSLCDSCIRACHRLGTGKCVEACKATPGVLDAIVQKSNEIAAPKPAADFCWCSECQDDKKVKIPFRGIDPPSRRLTQKPLVADTRTHTRSEKPILNPADSINDYCSASH